MCGRYRIKDPKKLQEHLRAGLHVEWTADGPRYNIAPSLDEPVIIMDDEGDVIVPATMRWGFVPYWDQSEKPKLAPINATAENLTTNGVFKQSAQKRRCLVPADGFYEWLRLDEKTKVAFDIHLKRDRPFFMAGVYEKATGNRPRTFAIVTTRPNELVAKIHTRMPAILDAAAAKEWLRPGPMTAERVATLTAPHNAEDMDAVSISSLVNNPRNDLPEVLEPMAFTPPPKRPQETQGELFGE
jgi:putative SOS response-associated peptidase YedK